MLRREKSCVSSLLGKDRPRDGSCVPTLEACATDCRPREEKERLLAFPERQPPTRRGPPRTTICPCSLHTGGDAGSNWLTLRSRCRRMGLVLGQQAVFQPVICSTNTAGCPALPARGGALVTALGTQGGCGNLPGAGLQLSVAPSRRLLGRQVWRSPQDGGGAGVTGLALFLSWGCCSESAQTGWLTGQQFVLPQPGGQKSTVRLWAQPWLFWRPWGGRFLLLRAFPGRQLRHPGLCRRPQMAPPRCARVCISLFL